MPIEDAFEFQSGYVFKTDWDFIFSDESDIKYYILSVTLPRMSLTHENHPTGLKFYNGTEFVDTVTIEFIEDSEFYVMDFLERLFGIVYDRERRVFRQLNDKSDLPNGLLTLYRGRRVGIPPFITVESETVAQYEMRYMRITNVDESTFSHEDSEPLTYSVQFAVEEIVRTTGSNTPVAPASNF